MNSSAENLYAAWRERGRAADRLADDLGPPPEKLLQIIWLHQRLKRDQLTTTDGRPVRVFHPGFLSREGGPDFRGAVLQIGDDKAVVGDVEIDLQAGGWRAHGHDRNPTFQSVALHVVWTAPAKSATTGQPLLPLLALQSRLDAPLAELALALENPGGLPDNLRGKCAAPLRELAPAQITALLHAAAKLRFRHKAAALLARARQAGWEGALWEYLFRALGYKHNVWPMHNLAETRERWLRGAGSVFEIQARLLGLSGLLPEELTRSRKAADSFLRQAWDFWWRERDAFADCRLPRMAWKLHGLRPANHPQRRLALAAHWLADPKILAKIEAWGTGPGGVVRARNNGEAADHKDRELVNSLQAVFQVARDEFWSWHWTLKSARLSKPQTLLGHPRVTDLAINVVLPWLWVRAGEGGNPELQAEVERRYFAWPAAEDNAVLKLARQRLLGTTRAGFLNRAADQQGLLQIVSDFCEQSNALCADCRFPELVSGFKARAAA